MRTPGLFNWALAVGLIVGPGLGAMAAALLFGMLNGSMEYFGYFFAVSGTYGYGALPVFVLVMLAMRQWRIDSLWLCVLIGFIIGIAGFVVVLDQQVGTLGQAQLAAESALPFAFMMAAIRLIAGRRT